MCTFVLNLLIAHENFRDFCFPFLQPPSDVDFRVMLTFVEFYTTMVGFVNFKLYNMLNLHYPPKVWPFLSNLAQGVVKGERGKLSTSFSQPEKYFSFLESILLNLLFFPQKVGRGWPLPLRGPCIMHTVWYFCFFILQIAGEYSNMVNSTGYCEEAELEDEVGIRVAIKRSWIFKLSVFQIRGWSWVKYHTRSATWPNKFIMIFNCLVGAIWPIGIPCLHPALKRIWNPELCTYSIDRSYTCGWFKVIY